MLLVLLLVTQLLAAGEPPVVEAANVGLRESRILLRGRALRKIPVTQVPYIARTKFSSKLLFPRARAIRFLSTSIQKREQKSKSEPYEIITDTDESKTHLN